MCTSPTDSLGLACKLQAVHLADIGSLRYMLMAIKIDSDVALQFRIFLPLTTGSCTGRLPRIP